MLADSDALVDADSRCACRLLSDALVDAGSILVDADSEALVDADSDALVLADSDTLVDADSEADVLADSECACLLILRRSSVV